MSESALRRWALRNLVVADGPRAGRPFRIASAPWGDVLDAMDNPDLVPIQRCWAHKIRNVLGKVKKADRKAAKAGLHAIMNAQTVPRGTVRRPPLRGPLARHLPQSRRLPEEQPR